jgi:hypothetical protein
MKRIKYVSQFARDLRPEDIDALVAQAASNNAARQVTGILMSSGRVFFQILEGPEAAVDDLFARISADPRHRDVLLLAVEGDIPSRYFPDWSMRRVALDGPAEERMAPARALLLSINEKRRELDRLTTDLERAIVAELARGR